MAHPGAYRGTKRQKELKRLQKQEEKRQKRVLKKGEEPHPDEGVPEFPLEGPVLPEGLPPLEPEGEITEDHPAEPAE
jgi:hypothetical protein